MSEPSYLKLYREGEFKHRTEKALNLMSSCRVCPRNCGVDRLAGEKGFCNTGRKAKVASYNAHFGEEAPLVGQYGSGTIFISSCNLLCNFCQNYDISHQNEGTEVEPAEMAHIMIRLADQGCHNINFVTPTHVIPQILEAIPHAVEMGLNLPIVYNSSGYDSRDTLEILDGIVDIYMPDFKFWDGVWAERYCQAPDYTDVAVKAIKEMYRQVGDLLINDQGLAIKGLLVRHLVMPGSVAGTENILDFLAREISPRTYVNVMDQYRPCGAARRDEFINRRLTAREFRRAVDIAGAAGLERLDSRNRIRFLFGQ